MGMSRENGFTPFESKMVTERREKEMEKSPVKQIQLKVILNTKSKKPKEKFFKNFLSSPI